MYFRSEDFPTPVPPTRRMVYDLFFGVLTIPYLRNFASLVSTVRTDTSKVLLKLLDSQAVTGVGSKVAWADNIVGRFVGKGSATGRIASNSVVIHASEPCGRTHGLGSTSTVVSFAGVTL